MNDILIDIELVVIYLVILVTTVITIWSAVRSLKKRDRSQNIVNNIPVTKIAYGVTALLVVCLLLTFLLGSSKPIQLGEKPYVGCLLFHLIGNLIAQGEPLIPFQVRQ